jgi:hypothetical protein
VQSGRDILHGLMVQGVYAARRCTQGGGSSRCRLDGDRVRSGLPAAAIVVIARAFALRRNVLNEAAAEGHVQDLNAAADREHRLFLPLRLEHKGDLGYVALIVHRLELGVRLLPEKRRIHVFAAG